LGVAGETLIDKLKKLKVLQKQQSEERQRIAKELRNEERKRKRLRARATALTDSDLFQVWSLRQAQRARRLEVLPAASGGASKTSRSEESPLGHPPAAVQDSAEQDN
jgi:hypothetical protein